MALVIAQDETHFLQAEFSDEQRHAKTLRYFLVSLRVMDNEMN